MSSTRWTVFVCALLAVGGLVVARPAVAADSPGALCGQVVGGMTVTSFSTDGTTPCVLNGPGTFTIAAGGTAQLGNVTLAQGLRLVNNGIVQLATGDCANPPTVRLNAGTVFDNALSVTMAYCSVGSAMTGSGTVVNEASGNWVVPYSATIDPTFENDGSLVANDALTLRHPAGFTGGVLTGGTYTAPYNGHFALPGGIVTNAADIVVTSGADYQRIRGGSALTALRTNTGTIEVLKFAPVNDLVNHGTISVATGATLHGQDAVTFAADGRLALGVGGPGARGRVTAAGAVQLDGALTIVPKDGSTPVVGNRYPVVSAPAGVTGAFASVGGDAPTGTHWAVEYGATTVTAELVADSPIALHVDATNFRVELNAHNYPLTVTGQGFQRGATVSFGDPYVTAGTVTVVNNRKLTVNVTTGMAPTIGLSAVTITNPDGASATCATCIRTLTAPNFTDSFQSPEPVGAGYSVLLYLHGSYARLLSAAFVEGQPGIALTTRFSDEVFGPIPSSTPAGTYDVTVIGQFGGRDVCVGCLVVVAAPSITSAAPSTLRRGFDVRITLTGTNFTASASIYANSIKFTNVSIVDSTTITASASVDPAAPAGSATITVQNGYLGDYGQSTFTGVTLI